MSDSVFANAATDATTVTASGGIITWIGPSATTKSTNNSSIPAFSNGFLPVMLLGIQLSYQRNVQPYYPINTSKTGNGAHIYRVAGTPRGVLQARGILSVDIADAKEFFAAVGLSCAASLNDHAAIRLDLFDGCEFNTAFALEDGEDGYRTKVSTSGKTPYFILDGLLLDSTGINLQGSEAAIAEMPLSFSFVNMKIRYPDSQQPGE